MIDALRVIRELLGSWGPNGALQLLKLLHFALSFGELALLTIGRRQTEVRLRSERGRFFQLDDPKPCFLGGRSIALERSGFAQRVESFRHVRPQRIGPLELPTRFARFALLQQGGTEAVKSFGASGLQLCF